MYNKATLNKYAILISGTDFCSEKILLKTAVINFYNNNYYYALVCNVWEYTRRKWLLQFVCCT